ncbi:hypothetical protein CU254_42070 (plasmid) [Amycolatopsis sp. AA4]|uniref:hypothetical protein n=1 Tax=Actinomycetes TaxID=1760 RepID=UPI0001B56C07|nr:MULTISPECIES: hypothetical protein [Actinomycetes]ATY17166.1 hypothetical protein CU254_42070 [Amycolatopsis sp. AA4]
MTSDDDWVYHGCTPEEGDRRIDVETSASGPTQRESATVLRRLRPQISSMEGHTFGWGYNGNGTSVAAAAILTDLLELPADLWWGTMSTRGEDTTLVGLREALCREVLVDAADEWRLSRIALLRWTCGWYTLNHLGPYPAVVAGIRPGFRR